MLSVALIYETASVAEVITKQEEKESGRSPR
jgi:hypothetical protein